MLIETIVGALVPVGAEAVKQLVTRFTGGVRPTSIAEQIQLDNSEIERLKALAALDNPGGTPSQWVIDIRASSRYIGSLGVIAVGIGSIFISDLPADVKNIALQAANIAFGFLFGSRIQASWAKK
jgi:hypothetical protein